jgi:ABC-2 type transport system permease protein
VKGVLSPPANASVQQQLDSVGLQVFISRLLPSQLYSEISTVLLQPTAGSSSISAPATVGQLAQQQQQIPGINSIDQSLLLVWPQTLAMVALMVICFAAAYVLFMRQEVRA